MGRSDNIRAPLKLEKANAFGACGRKVGMTSPPAIVPDLVVSSVLATERLRLLPGTEQVGAFGSGFSWHRLILVKLRKKVAKLSDSKCTAWITPRFRRRGSFSGVTRQARLAKCGDDKTDTS